ncbi:MAG: sulfotransferase, partial [Xanthomonadales bacterium]|nr:sulfotransferase [Xanthomonadales bacterium]
MNLNNIQQQKLNQVRHLAQQRQIPQALSLVKEITQNYPEFAPAWYTSAFLLFQNSHIDEAISAINTAIKLEPDNIKFRYQKIMLYEALHRPDIVLPLTQELVREPLQNNEMNEKLARILEINEDFNGALKLYQHLTMTHPNKTSWLLKQAAMLQNLGDIEQAVVMSNKALEREPNNPDGQFFRSHLKKQTIKDNHIDILKQSCSTTQISAQNKAKFYYALAKELEDCEKYDQSFKARATGAELFRSSFQYDVQSDIDFMQQIQIKYTEQFINQKSTNTSDRPIFIVGLPRSGTTLLDRIITSHSDVKAAGELKQMNTCVIQGLQKLKIDPQISRTKMVTASTQLDFKLLGETYLQTSRARAAQSPRFTDKF